MTTAKRQTLADYLYLSICQGQQQTGPIGYSPLPINLVQASFAQINLLKQADPAVDIASENVTTCHNPTFIAGQPDKNYLAQVAPQPPSCDKNGVGPCTTAGDTGQLNPGQKAGSSSGSGANGSTGSAGSASGGTTSSPRALIGGSGKPGSNAVGHVDPVTGQTVFPDSGNGGGVGAQGAAQASATELRPAQSASEQAVLAVIAAAMLLGLLLVPPLVGRALKRKVAP